ncbi:MAG TPA: hypothetical protein VEY07_06715 [Thermoplasmata archaeon]|nr:hypothetical protein [Thermoplasmata archaeon]
MRPGLVVIGVTLLVLGVAGLVSLFLVPIPSPATTSTASNSWTAGPGAGNSTEIVGPAAHPGSLTLRWQSTFPLTAAVYTSGGCPPGTAGCPGWHLAASWTAAVSGNWTVDGTVQFPYLFVWSNPSQRSGSVVLSTETVTPASATLSPLSELLLGLGVGVVAFGGGLSLFLGLFLRAGVYRGPPPVVSKSADDVADIVDSDDAAGPPGRSH